MVHGEAWVIENGKERFAPVVFIKAKDCKNDINNFDLELGKEDSGLVRASEIAECYMRYSPNEHHDWGKGYWEACDKGKGAARFFYASVDCKSRV